QLLHSFPTRRSSDLAKRSQITRPPFKAEDVDYKTFEGQFPYDETPDQLSAIQAILDDMRSEKPMDRLICGDVGFGKTEVAMRARSEEHTSELQSREN